MEIGTRVGAILGGSNEEVEFLGYGKYMGEDIPIEAIGFMADLIRDTKRKNPKIELDSGEVVYGCECWWGSEEKVKSMLKNKKVNNVSIVAIREQVRNEETKGGN